MVGGLHLQGGVTAGPVWRQLAVPTPPRTPTKTYTPERCQWGKKSRPIPAGHLQAPVGHWAGVEVHTSLQLPEASPSPKLLPAPSGVVQGTASQGHAWDHESARLAQGSLLLLHGTAWPGFPRPQGAWMGEEGGWGLAPWSFPSAGRLCAE